ncbi:MAG TPA: CPBP family intramembrane glutamic endopeptidase [Allosphingosinicella sp.]
MSFERSQVRAVAEVAAVAAAYILISTTAVGAVDASFLFPAGWSAAERSTGGGFLVGALVQVALVLVGACLLRLADLRRAIAATFAPSTRQAWTIALIATAIHIGTAMLLFLPEPRRVWETSDLNLILSAVPAADGWSQEVLFRGYVLFRLARAEVAAPTAILLSGGFFAAIHFGYAGETAWETLSPLVGTFMLGCFYAWSVLTGRFSLKPVVCCHILIIVVLQPWLALTR